MHEFSLVEELLDEVLHATATQADTVLREIHVECGPLSGVEPLLLDSAFDILAPERLGAGCQLVIEQVPLRARCETCDSQFEPTLFDFRCSLCGSERTRVTRGDALILKRVVLDDRTPAASAKGA